MSAADGVATFHMRVLVADDDLVSRRILVRALRAWAFEPEAVADGEAALVRLTAPDAPPAAILDWAMPGLDGPEVCERVRRARPETPPYVILATGKTGSADVVRGLEAGADDYVTKPIDLDVLRARLRVGERMVELQQALALRIAELDQAHQRFRALVDGIDVVVWEADDGADRCDFVSTRAQEVLGHPPAACASVANRASWVHADDRDAWRAALDRLRSEPIVRHDYRLMRGDGHVVWLRDVVRAVDLPNGARRLRGLTEDVTVQKQAEEALRAALSMQSTFVSFASHQLRTPLAGVKWMLELAADPATGPDDAREYVETSLAAAGRLTGLVNDLLDVSRLESGRSFGEPARVSVAALTTAAIGEIQPLVARHGHALTLVGSDVEATAMADAQLLKQVMLNLLSNAVKYTPHGGRIEVGRTLADADVHWWVADSGIGIPPECQVRLFEKFYRASNVTALETEGTGLGLYMVRLILSRFGGRIWCDSTEAGTRFTLALPRAEAA